ncbi:cistern family PEP-CTERM protein [Novosphingobium huizhouense]|uniref:cistern family PEP-CTERM protein n=1 Tax=Novosphingobium huizhouense TaxID=2866625 RepID=UPI001CD867F4|nr:cistern family PEP-CTERM protein [Novosphingobium huizhouense]
MRLNRSIASLAAIASFAFAGTALADSMTFGAGDINKSVTLTYNGYSGNGGATIGGLTGSTTFTLTGVSGNTYNFNYSVTNTSATPVTESRISSFAFNTDPTIASATSTGAFSQTTLNSNYPNGIGTVDVCFKDATTGSCAGGGGGGLTLGQTGTGAFSLSFSSPATAVTLSDFFVRYQSIAGIPGISSASGAGTISSPSGSGTKVPEPGMLGLFGLGLAGLALARRRQVLRRA